MTRKELKFPFKGLVDSRSANDQPEDTTTEMLNMRGFDPKTGRLRGGQRPGLAKYTATQVSGANKIQALATVSYDKNRIKYTQRAEPEEEWAKVLPAHGAAYAGTVDSSGSIFVFDSKSFLLKYNSDGELLATISLPLGNRYTIVHRIAIDEFDNVYVAATHDGYDETVVWRFGESEGGTYTKRWTLSIEGAARDLIVANDMLYFALNRSLHSDEGAETAHVVAYSGASLDAAPLEIWSRLTAYPCNSLSVMPSGDIVAVSPPNEARVPVADEATGVKISTVNWTPAHLDNAAERLHFWYDASYPRGHEDGDRITTYLSQQRNRTDYLDSLDVHDTTVRRLYAPAETRYDISNADGGDANPHWKRYGPKYETNAVGSMPALRFNGSQTPEILNLDNLGNHTGSFTSVCDGEALESSTNSDEYRTEQKTSRTDALSNTPGVIPTRFNHGASDPYGTRFGFFVVFKLDPGVLLDDKPTVIWTMEPHRTSYASDYFASYTLMACKNDVAAPITDGTAFAAGPEGEVATLYFVVSPVCISNNGYDVGQPRPTAFEILRADDSDISVATVRENGFCVFSFIHPGLEQDGVITNTVNAYPNQCGAVRLNGRPMGRLDFWPNTSGAPSGRGIVCDGHHAAYNLREHCGRFIFGGPLGTKSGVILGDTWGSGNYINGTRTDSEPMWIGPKNETGSDKSYQAFSGLLCEMLTVLPDTLQDDRPNNDILGFLPRADNVAYGGRPGARWDDSWGYGNSDPDDPDNATDVERIEGYLAYKWGIQDVLPGVGPTSAPPQYHDGLYYNHPFSPMFGGIPSVDGQDTSSGWEDSEYSSAIQTVQGLMTKLRPTGDVVYAVAGGGIGYGVVTDDDGNIFTTGPALGSATNPMDASSEADVIARKIVDHGEGYSTLDTDGAWSIRRASPLDSPSYEHARLEADGAGDFYWPIASELKSNHMRKISGLDGTQLSEYSLGTNQKVYSVVVPRLTPIYGDQDVSGPEFVYITSDNVSSGSGEVDPALPQIHKVRMVDADHDILDGLSTRASETVAVAGGNISVVDRGAVATVPPGGDSAFLDAGGFISLASTRKKVYFADGLSYKVYDPAAGEVTDWTAKSAGEIPKRGRLLSSWRGRMIVARTADEPDEWHMSAINDPEDWDQYPPVFIATQAISGKNSRAGRMPDIVNTVIPYSDDLLLFGGDKSVWRLTGDPMAGGQFDLISDSVGMAFGRSWCKDRDGVIYFFSSEGAVYAMSPNGQLRNLSQLKVSRRIDEIDLSRYRVELAWSDEEQGVYMFQVPHAYGGLSKKSYFWDRRLDAWFEDEFSSPSFQPSALTVIDGDAPQDRKLLLGCHDGYLRVHSRNKPSDDGSTIDSHVLFGPIGDEEMLQEIRLGGISAELGSDQSGANLELFGSPVADVMGEPVFTVPLYGGRNKIIHNKMRASNAWIRLRNARTSERWALEALSTDVTLAGRKRIR